ncbi:MGMT family protein [Odoribacter sp. OttesenSCG-928-J03]|nr:MGMT family protein [Odoribacter sp. OttesenSCG-928-J03]
MFVFERESFDRAVYDVVRRIPRGRATSYGAIARAIGHPNMSRMVGQAMSKCCSADTGIPAHRVVNSQGVLSAKDCFGHPEEMQRLLESEGIVVANNKIRHWKKVFWNPIAEIK